MSKNKFFFLMTLLFSLSGFAYNHDDCVTELSSEPNCITLANSHNFCDTYGDSKKMVQSVTNCMRSILQMTSQRDATAMCLGGYINTTDKTMNVSYFKDN